jgi:arylsulfatase A-like enzyme
MYPASKVALPRNFMSEHPFDNGDMKLRDEQLAPWPRTPEVIREHIAAYYAMITHADAQIGRVLEALDASGQADNTVVVFAADNGLAVGQHGLLGKQNLYEHSVRVPLVMRGPGIPRGVRRDALCYLSDLHPTLCEMAGVAAPAGLVDGKGLRTVVERGGAVRESVFYAYRHLQRGVRTRDWKLLEYNVAGKRTTQLFHLRDDPWELRNLAAGDARRVGEMRELLRRWMKEADDPVDLDAATWSLAPARG